jgi:hypothetical protein
MPSRRLLLIVPLSAALLSVSGCRDEKIVTYRVAKDAPSSALPTSTAADPHAGTGLPPVGQSAPSSPMNTMASTAVPTAGGADLGWTAPAGWQSRPASAMRKATYIIPGAGADQSAELSVTAFPGDVGGNLANLNRWRGQLHLAPITEAELDSALTHLDVGDLHIDIAELLGPESTEGKARQRVVGAIVPINGATWFFKLTGPDALVSSVKPDFMAFLQTLKPAL